MRTSARFANAPPGSSSPADSSHAPVTIAGRFALHVAHAFRTNSSSAPAWRKTSRLRPRGRRRFCVNARAVATSSKTRRISSPLCATLRSQPTRACK